MPIPDEWTLPQAIRKRLGDKVGRQRAMCADGHLLLILHRVPQAQVQARDGVFFWRDAQGGWHHPSGGEGLALLRQHLDHYDQAIDHLEQQFDPYSEADRLFPVLQQVVRVHRSAKNGHAALQKARDAIKDDHDLISIRDRAGEIERSVELLHIDIKNAVDYAVARQAEQQSRAGHQLAKAGNQLNTLAAIFLPLTALVSIFGMDLMHGLDRNNPFVFWGVVVIGVLMGVLLRAYLPGVNDLRSNRAYRRRSEQTKQPSRPQRKLK